MNDNSVFFLCVRVFFWGVGGCGERKIPYIFLSFFFFFGAVRVLHKEIKLFFTVSKTKGKYKQNTLRNTPSCWMRSNSFLGCIWSSWMTFYLCMF